MGEKMHPGWRVFWGVFGAGLSGVLLTISGWGLALPVVIAIAVGFGLLVAIVGPMLLDLLDLFT